MKLCPKCQKHFSDDANFCPVDAARLVPLDKGAGQGGGELDALGARFELGAKLGGSRTGAVHKAIDKTTSKPCVVKLIAKEVLALPGVAQRLERELKQLERVHGAGVARVLASGKRGDDAWVAVEMLDGAQTLAEAIVARGPIAVDQAASLVEVIGEALIEAAQVGVVHRDLAPKNVLFAGQDVKLINFSLPVPTTDKIPGVPEFVAPEQVDGRPVDQRSNLYSLGALYYFVLTGQTVVHGSVDEAHRAHQAGSIKPPTALGIPVPTAVEAVIMRALDRSPTKRFLTVRQFVDEVARVAAAGGVAAAAAAPAGGEVVDLKQTMAHGRANKPKAELVQTLMGIRTGGGAGAPITTAPTVQPAALATAIATAPTPQAAVSAAPAARAPASGGGAPSTMVGIAAGGGAAAQPATTPGPSPWAAPAQPAATPAIEAPRPAPVVAAPVVAAPVVAKPAPVVAAPVVAAPVVAAPVVAKPVVAKPAQAAAGAQGKKKAPDEASAKGKFRETMWFKKGELDAQAAQAAAEERARTGKDHAADKADSLPMDERYKDDGSITGGDKEKYSLRTGATQMMSAIPDRGPDGGGKVSEDALIGEMKSGRKWVMVAIALAAVAIVILVLMITR